MSRWDGIEEAVAVEAAGSFIGAASALDVSTSHISRAIARLEAATQAQIFHRTTRRVTVTDTGRVLIEQFRRIIRERDEAIAGANSGGEPQGELRLTCSTALGEQFVVPIVQAFMRDYAQVSVSIELTNRVVDLIGEGFDLAVRTGRLADSRLIATRLATRGLRLCASVPYLRDRGAPASVSDLLSHECLIGTSPTWHFTIDGKEEVFRPAGRLRCNSGRAIAEAALAGMGICQLPNFYVASHVRDGTLVPILEDLVPPKEPVWAVYHPRRHLEPKVRRLAERLKKDLEAQLSLERQFTVTKYALLTARDATR